MIREKEIKRRRQHETLKGDTKRALKGYINKRHEKETSTIYVKKGDTKRRH